MASFAAIAIFRFPDAKILGVAARGETRSGLRAGARRGKAMQRLLRAESAFVVLVLVFAATMARFD